MRNERNRYKDVPFSRACPIHKYIPRLLRQLMARNVCPGEYMVTIICYQAYELSLQDIQQADNVHSVKDTVPYRKARLLKINPRQYEETPWQGVRVGQGRRRTGQGGEGEKSWLSGKMVL